MKRFSIVWACVAIMLVTLLESALRAGDARSTPAAKQLASLMTERKLDSFAARDPQDADRFVAALLFPGVQLLLVSAQSPSAAALDALLASRNYREVYAALQQPASAASRIFFIDMGCDGLQEDGGNVDVMYEGGTSQTLFDGNPDKQKLSRSAYAEKLARADEQYARLLTALVASINAPTTEPSR
jgi:hypothetical protein